MDVSIGCPGTPSPAESPGGTRIEGADADFLDALVERELPPPSGRGYASDLDDWTRGIPNFELVCMHLEGPSCPLGKDRRKDVVRAVLHLHFGSDPRVGSRGLVDLLDRALRMAEKGLRPHPEVRAYLWERARARMVSETARARLDPVRLAELLVGGTPSSVDGALYLDFGVEIPAPDAIAAFRSDHRALWTVARHLGSEAFESVFGPHDIALRDSLADALMQILRGSGPFASRPGDFLGVLPDGMGDPRWPLLVLTALAPEKGPAADPSPKVLTAWLESLVRMRGWNASAVRSLVLSTRLAELAPRAYFDLAWSVTEGMGAGESATRSFAALTLMHTARSHRQRFGRPEDEEREIQCRERAGRLPSGSVICRLAAMLASVPPGDAAKTDVWNGQCTGARENWRDEALALLRRRVGLARGFIEHAFACLPQRTYDGIDSAVLNYLCSRDEAEFLATLVRSEHARIAVRAADAEAALMLTPLHETF